MTSEQLATEAPRGFIYYELKGQLVVQCRICDRRWWAARIGEKANQEYLASHVDDHRQTRRHTAQQLGIKPVA